MRDAPVRDAPVRDAPVRDAPVRDGASFGLSRPIRVLIVDDSAVARAVLARIVAADRDFTVVGEAANAESALELLNRTSVDIVTLDVEMPGTDGLTALPAILRAGRGARVMIVSSIAERGAQAAVRALALGAADTLPKPGGGRPHGNFAQVLVSKLRAIGRVRREEVDGRSDLPPASETCPLRAMPSTPIACVAVGASTGGLPALTALFGALPRRLGVPLFVTQHLPALFIPFFARQLAELTGRVATVAADGDVPAPDCILVAPGDGHLTVERRAGTASVRIDRSGSVGRCMPAVDPMFASLADHYGAGACAVVLTGMGRDGSAGSARVAAAGGTVLAQDRASAPVWGMPRAVAEAGHACAVLPPAGIARRIAARLDATATRGRA